MSLPNRRPVTHERVGPFIVSIGFDPKDGRVCEVFFSKRSKPGTELDDVLYEMGTVISRYIQGRAPL